MGKQKSEDEKQRRRIEREDAAREAQNQLKLQITNFKDAAWEETRVKFGPFWVTKRIPKETASHALKNQRASEMEAEGDLSFEDEPPEPLPIPAILAQRPQNRPRGLVSRFKSLFSRSPTAAAAPLPRDKIPYQKPAEAKKPTFIEKATAEEKRQARLRKERRRRAKLKQLDDRFDRDAEPEPEPEKTEPVKREEQGALAIRPSEDFLWDLREQWASLRMYVSADSSHMFPELRLLLDVVLPKVQAYGRERRVRVVPVALTRAANGGHDCGMKARLEEMKRSHVILLFQGTVYGEEEVEEEEGTFRSIQEIEAIQALKLGKGREGSDVRAAAGKNRRQDKTQSMGEACVVLLQRGRQFMEGVPEDFHHFFEDSDPDKRRRQTDLRNKCNKAADAQQAVEKLIDYPCSFEQTDEDDFELGRMEVLEEFLQRTIEDYILTHFDMLNPHALRLTNLKIDARSQRSWLIRNRPDDLATSSSAPSSLSSTAPSSSSLYDKLAALIQDPGVRTPILLLGCSGQGKTSFLVNFLYRYFDSETLFSPDGSDPHSLHPLPPPTRGSRHRGRVFPEVHFTCASVSARNPSRMLRRLCAKVAARFFIMKPEEVEDDYDGLCEDFRRCCRDAAWSSRGDELLVFVDSIEELSCWERYCSHVSRQPPWLGNGPGCMAQEQDALVEAAWIPEEFPAPPAFSVKLVLTLNHEARPDILAALRARTYRPVELELEPTSHNDCVDLLQRMYILSQLEAHERVERVSNTLTDLMGAVLNHMEDHEDREEGLVGELLALLSVTRRGLLEEESWDVMRTQAASLQFELSFARFLQVVHTAEPLLECVSSRRDVSVDSVMRLKHVLVLQLVRSRYVSSGEAEAETHEHVGEMFLRNLRSLKMNEISEGTAEWLRSRTISDMQARAASEVGFHCIGARRKRDFVNVLCSLRLLEVRFILKLLPVILEDYRLAIAQLEEEAERLKGTRHMEVREENLLLARQLREFAKFACDHSSELILRPSNTFQSAANSAPQLAPNISARSMIENKTERRIWLKYHNRKLRDKLAAQLQLRASVVDLSVTADFKFAVLGMSSRELVVIDVLTNTKKAELKDIRRSVESVAIFGKFAEVVLSGSSDGWLTWWNPAGGMKEMSLQLHDSERGRINREHEGGEDEGEDDEAEPDGASRRSDGL
ncbi:hypothetical protein GUITHDRAFT_112660 [Guillardia theta CCMP2712]|uniref:Uncharacterized protein n=1 Tax=Guillardia theta (strain CCMP2712) TaxID=905079 RepID=L1IY67_GUITC|nr:hypothetical protein GUITHDRAFT_112660 [Guillardia theta CCMP2712]EKX41186.1 hypothetical protein GUITHDRAFT_112660 [Guillardia theta CCMP2712]|eukprot:XP_005828166.1 hypothetical protein GUITHDRAFT_112660 [Guillardia theta CCMP2712]